MFSIKKWFQFLIVFTIILLNLGGHTIQAEGLDGSVKDFYEDPDKPTDKKAEETDSKENAASPKSTGLSFWDFLRMVFATIFVVALLYLALRFINKKSRAYQKANHIENIGGTSLGSNRSVQLIKVGNSILVVGVGETIQLLKEIEDGQEYQAILQEYNDKMDLMIQPGHFVSKLKKRLTGPNSNSTGFSLQLKKQLEELSSNRKKAIEELDEGERD